MKIYHKITKELIFEGKKSDLRDAYLRGVDLRHVQLINAEF